jgi:hypothetical protein
LVEHIFRTASHPGPETEYEKEKKSLKIPPEDLLTKHLLTLLNGHTEASKWALFLSLEFSSFLFAVQLNVRDAR